MRMTILLSAGLFLLNASAASAHAFLDHASPAVGGTVQHAPRQVSMWFTEGLEPAFSGAMVRNAQGTRVDGGRARVGGANKAEMQIGLKHLPPGTYKVFWHVMSVDTHRTQGSFSFTVSGH